MRGPTPTRQHRRPRPWRRALSALAVAGAVVLGAGAPGDNAASQNAPSGDTASEDTTSEPANDQAGGPSVEQARLDGPVPREILARSRFDDVVPALTAALAQAQSYEQAEQVVVEQGRAVWQRAVGRVQERGPRVGDLSADDDRPLYWARLGMTGAVRAWQPGAVGLDEGQRARLVTALETTSRGQDTIVFPGVADEGSTRVLVTGFDPFQLDDDPRRSNPSGAAALALDGTIAQTPAGPVRIEAAMFPVRWSDFARGSVERTLEPHLPHVDLVVTMSQGSPGRFDLERTNGAWRGGSPDNDGVSESGPVPVDDPASQPQWTTSTLPYTELVAANRGPFPVVDNTTVLEVPAGEESPVPRASGPTPGSQAREGGGGDYLSNEIAYRVTLLRDRLGLGDRLPGGHLHTPVLSFGEGNADPSTGMITDDALVAGRLAIVGQSRAVVLSAAEAIGRG